MVHNSWQKCVNMLADDIYLGISPHMIDNGRTGWGSPAIVIWRRGCRWEKGGDGRLWVCRCVIIKDVCVVCVPLLCVPLGFVCGRVCMGRYVFDCVLLGLRLGQSSYLVTCEFEVGIIPTVIISPSPSPVKHKVQNDWELLNSEC